MNFFKCIKNQTGFTLAEVMVSAAIGSILALGVAGLFVFALEQFAVMQGSNQAQESLLLAAFHTKSYLSQAVDIHGVNSIPNPISQGSILAQYTSTYNGTPIPVAIFQREDGDGAGGVNVLKGTSIFYVPPTSSGSGVVYFDPVGSGNTFTFGASQIWYDQLVAYDIQPSYAPYNLSALSTTQPIERVSVHIVTRSFKTSDRSKWNWCYPISATCKPAVAFKDYEMLVEVGLRNNNLDTTGTKQKFLYGGVYFFKFLPTVNLNPSPTP